MYHIMKKALLLIVLVAFSSRTYKISQNPPSLSWDEVSIGYNAYSILKTGRDEHGKFLPLDAFVSYGDYKPPLSIYATVPFVALFGLNEIAVRLPSAIFGTLTVLLTYYLVVELIPSVALLSAALLAISPWHINLSRGGFEANIALFFAVLGVWLALSARSYPKRWLYVWLPFVAAIYTFNSSRVFSVLLFPALVIYTYNDIRKNVRLFAIGIIIATVAMLPILPHLISKEARLRFTEVNIFTDLSVVETSNARIARESGSIFAKIINNRRVGYARNFLIHFTDNLRPEFLFEKGDGNPKFSIQDVGQLYIIEAPFLAIGIFALLTEYPAIALLLLYWLIAAIIPAAFARETPHALRILNSLPAWQIFIAFGIAKSVQYVKKKWLVAFVVLLYCFSVVYYLHTYYRHYPIEFSGEWQYGYREAIQRITPIASKYDKIIITDAIGRPYMYTLFYTKTDPRDVVNTVDAHFDAAGFYHVDGFLKYRFGGKLPDTLNPKTLYIWDAGTVPTGARVIDTIYLLNGKPVLTIFDI
jgi:4-amino-4-deoxy-L-arabinose transferase-like glycosyltransferase